MSTAMMYLREGHKLLREARREHDYRKAKRAYQLFTGAQLASKNHSPLNNIAASMRLHSVGLPSVRFWYPSKRHREFPGIKQWKYQKGQEKAKQIAIKRNKDKGDYLEIQVNDYIYIGWQRYYISESLFEQLAPEVAKENRERKKAQNEARSQIKTHRGGFHHDDDQQQLSLRALTFALMPLKAKVLKRDIAEKLGVKRCLNIT